MHPPTLQASRLPREQQLPTAVLGGAAGVALISVLKLGAGWSASYGTGGQNHLMIHPAAIMTYMCTCTRVYALQCLPTFMFGLEYHSPFLPASAQSAGVPPQSFQLQCACRRPLQLAVAGTITIPPCLYASCCLRISKHRAATCLLAVCMSAACACPPPPHCFAPRPAREPRC